MKIFYKTKTRLVFYYWISEHGFSNIINVHYDCLKYYKNIFDEALFVLSIDNLENHEKIESIKNSILSIGFKNLYFKIIKNNINIRESICVKEIIDTLNDYDGLTFFAHTKGASDYDTQNFLFKYMSHWVVQMYYFNLNYINDVKTKLINENYLAYGAMMMENSNIATNRYRWYYPGTFFWINGKKIKKYIKYKNITVPGLDDWSTIAFSQQCRYYSENILGAIFPSELAASSLKKYDKENYFQYNHLHIKDKITKKEYNNYKKFYEKMVPSNKNKICVYAICKNEYDNIDKWAQSMSEADYVVVLDTGSDDGSVEKLKTYGIEVKQKIIKPWRFDVARNESMKLIPDDCNILVCTDLDEYFEPGWAQVLRDNWDDTKHRQASYFKTNIFPGVDGYYNEIHGRGFKWKFPVHEALYNDEEDYRTLELGKSIILHHEPDMTKSRSSYFDLLKLRKEEYPDDNYGPLFYLSECMRHGMYNEIIETCNQLLNRENFTDKYMLWYAHKYLAEAYVAIGEYENAEKEFLNAIKIDEENITAYIGYANFLDKSKNDLKKAAEVLSQGLKYAKNNDIWCYLKYDFNRVYDLLAIYYYYAGYKAKSLACAYKAYTLNPNDVRLKNNLDLIVDNMKPEDFI